MDSKKPEPKELSMDELNMVSGGEWTGPKTENGKCQCPFCLEWIEEIGYSCHIYNCYNDHYTSLTSDVGKAPSGPAFYVFDDYETPL